MPDPQKLIATIRRAAELFQATPGRKGSVITLDHAEEVLIIGDLHGNLPAFRQIYGRAELATKPGRHLVLQELIHSTDNQQYPDEGGDKSHQLLDVVCALKCQYPERVHLILGNHELSELTGRPIAKDGVYLNDLFRRGVQSAYGSSAREVIAAYHELFRSLPLAVRTPNRVVLCHTLPDARYLETLDLDILRTGEWTPASMARGGTVYALTWGRDISTETADRFAEMMDADLFIIGHQPCDEGHWQANDRVLIVDGTNPYPTYCLFPAQAPITMSILLAGVRSLSIAVAE